MKRVISIIIIAIASAAMIACDNTTKHTSRITAGDKSKMDSVSYCVAFSNTFQFCAEMPDVKLDWGLVAEACSQTILIPIEKDTDGDYEKVINETIKFFDSTRIERLSKIKLEKQGGNPNKAVDMKSELSKIDIFENTEERERISKAIGYELGYDFRNMPYHLQVHWFKKGIIDAAQPESISKAPIIEAFVNYYNDTTWPMLNAQRSAKWLSAISKELNVRQTRSGLLYRIDKMGDEKNMPNIHSTVTLNYESMCYDGRVYASTYRKGKPSIVQVERLIKGWAEGLQLIGKGGKITLWIPSRLAFDNKSYKFVGPNEAVQFNIEILDVETPNVQIQDAGFGPAPANNKVIKKSK